MKAKVLYLKEELNKMIDTIQESYNDFEEIQNL